MEAEVHKILILSFLLFPVVDILAAILVGVGVGGDGGMHMGTHFPC